MGKVAITISLWDWKKRHINAVLGSQQIWKRFVLNKVTTYIINQTGQNFSIALLVPLKLVPSIFLENDINFFYKLCVIKLTLRQTYFQLLEHNN